MNGVIIAGGVLFALLNLSDRRAKRAGHTLRTDVDISHDGHAPRGDDPTVAHSTGPDMKKAGVRPRLTVVDAANVVGARPDGWWKDRAGATRRLLDALARVAAGNEEVVLVVEGAARAGLPAGDVGRVRVVHAARSGDDAIVAIVRDAKAADSLRPVAVVTADRELRERVHEAGAEVIGPRTLWSRLETRAKS